VLLAHSCTFGEHEDGETVIFPEGTTRTMILTEPVKSHNRARILFPNGLELREMLDDEGTGKGCLLHVLSQESIEEDGRQ
jgi:hypothetical protein